jgi:hypothetical protein
MTFVLLEPTRMPMSLPDITINGPIFIERIPGMFSMPFIPPISPGEGLAAGIGIFIFCWGETSGLGEAAGICIPGISIFSWGEGLGDAAGICMPGIFIPIFPGDAAGDAAGIGMFISIFC